MLLLFDAAAGGTDFKDPFGDNTRLVAVKKALGCILENNLSESIKVPPCRVEPLSFAPTFLAANTISSLLLSSLSSPVSHFIVVF